LWGIAGPLRPDVASMMPNLVLPAGDMEAARLWEDYRLRCLAHESASEPQVRAVVDPESGEVVLVDENNVPVPSPTEAIGVHKLDPLSDWVARVFELGALVSVDKLSRTPPLEAPVTQTAFRASYRWAMTAGTKKGDRAHPRAIEAPARETCQGAAA
jgi:hypothetical protein